MTVGHATEGGFMAEDEGRLAVEIIYTNYRNERSRRLVVPRRIWFGSTEWHPEPQWLLDAFDLEKGAIRSFAMQDVEHWSAPVSPVRAGRGLARR